MIVTLTANPSLDRTIELEAPIAPGEVQPARAERVDAAGKGVNVARVIAAAGAETLAVVPLDEDDPFANALRASGIPSLRVPVAGRARSNITITDPAGVTTKLNLPGPALTDGEADALLEATVEAVDGARWLALAGSLPPGAGDDYYVRVARAVRARYGDRAPRIAVDASGAPLAAVVEAGVADLIKPNEDELAELVGVALDLETRDAAAEVLAAARRIVPSQVGSALVTLGAAGAMLVTADAAWRAAPPRIRVASTVGAGDSSLAGYLLADTAGAAPADALAHAVRYGAAAASMPGTQPPGPTDLPAGDIVVTPLS